MIGNKKILSALFVLIVAAAACAPDQYGRLGVRFKAQSSGFMNPGDKSSATKTSYSGQKTGSVERIDWTDGDVVRIWSNYAYIKDKPDRHWSDFCVESHSDKNALSTASISPASDPNSLQWKKGAGDHTFKAMYPSQGDESFADGVMTFTIPATQTITRDGTSSVWLPDMSYAPMLAKTIAEEGASSVNLLFSPQFTAYSFSISKGSLETVELSSFTLTSESGYIAGTFTAEEPGSATTTSGTQSITIDLTGIKLDDDMPAFTFTVFTLPVTVSGLRISFTADFNDSDTPQTASLTLKDNEKNALTFLPYLKYNITGLAFPEIIDATIEDQIIWANQVSIMDSYSWWIGAGLDEMEWLTSTNNGILPANLGDAYAWWIGASTEQDIIQWFSGTDTGIRSALLQDSFPWWIPSDLPEDINWDKIKSVTLSDDSDVYLWPGETVTRSVSVIGLSDTPFQNAEIAWLAMPSTGVVGINYHTGEVTARAPGEAYITARVTPHDGGEPWYASYKVYVNAVTGVTLTPATAKVGLDATKELTATITHTGYGTLSTYPTLTIAPANTTYVRINSADNTAAVNLTPVYATATTATATANAYGHAEGGPVNVTVTVPASASSTGSALTAISAVTCIGTKITITSPGEPYKFRGYYLSPGILQYEGGSYSLTGGLDGLASGMAAYGTAAGRTKHYFSWTELSGAFTTTSGTITGTVCDDGVNTWRIPKTNELGEINEYSPNPKIYVGSTQLSKGLVKIIVNLTGSALEGQGLTTDVIGSAGTSIVDGGPLSHTNYIAGLLYVPDGATITCSKMNGTVGSITAEWSTTSNCISYDDLEILVTGGCVFFPATGYFNGSSWCDGGNYGYYWTANESSTTTAYNVYFYSSNYYSTYNGNKSNNYMPVILIHDPE